MEEARELYDSEHGLARLEACLGLNTERDQHARIQALVGEVARRVSRWEHAPSDDLMADHEAISQLFAMTEKASMAADANDGRLPDTWWAHLTVEIERNGLYTRLIRQINRETHASLAKRAALKKADSTTGPKCVGPDTEGTLLAAARDAASEIEMHLDALEKMDDATLRENCRRVLQWHDALVESFSFSEPRGYGFEPAVLEYREWMRVRFVEFLQEWRQIVDSIPNKGAQRLLTLVDRVDRLMAAAKVVSESTSQSATARWSRLEPVKQWAFEERRRNPDVSRASVIRTIRDEILRRAKEAGTPLSGSDEAVTRTITRWFREAGIK